MRTTQAKASAVKLLKKSEENPYSVAAETMSVSEKLQVLEKTGRQDLVSIFKDWQPRQAKAKRRQAPLDQRVSITVTDQEKMTLLQEIDATNKSGERTTVSQFVRNRAIGSIDLAGWKSIAEEALVELGEIEASRPEIAKRERAIRAELENTDDDEETGMLEMELSDLKNRLKKIVAQNEKRTHRLAGRMSMAEAETVKWRAAQLSISTSDYLRFLIFDRLPNTSADAHLSLDAKRRFYVSILAVSEHGWGTPPAIAHCTQCGNYMDEIRRLRDRISQLETFV